MGRLGEITLHGENRRAMKRKEVPAAAASRSDKSLFIRDAFARLQIGGLDLKLKALASLLELLGNDPAAEAANIVAADGDVAALLRMLDASAHSALRDRAAAVVALLATACSASRKAVFDEGGLGPLLRVLDSASAPATRERAVVAIEAMTADAGSAWAVSAYGGVSILINACRPGSGSLAVQALAVAAIKNVVSIDDVRSALVEEGGLPVLVDLLASGTTDTQKNAALCLWSIASMGDLETQQQIVQDGALPPLLQALHITTDLDLQNSVLRAIHVLAVVPSAARILCSSPLFFAQLTDLMRRGGSILLQQMAADMIADLAPGMSDDTKRCMAPCVGTLVKMMEVAKPASVQESAGRALLALMTLKSNRKELVRDEKNLTRLVQMLNPRNEEIDKKHPVSVLLALAMGGGNGTRRRLADAGACQHLQKLADAEVPCAKKALQRMSSSRFKSLLSRGWNN
uniref:U-box domain-containing protein 4 n=1 Tax=Aegilops tauschii TaxID=37682 RepID=N1R1Q7_AEGTA